MKIRRLTAALLIVALSFSQVSVVLADKKTDAQNKEKEAQEDLNNKNAEIDKIKANQDKIQADIDKLDSDLVQVMIDLSTLEEDLAIKQDELAQTKEDLKQAKKDEKTQYKAMKKRIQFMYERGDTTVLASILESDSISDLLNRVEYFNEVYDYDRNLLITYQETKEQVATLEQQQEEHIAELESTQVEYQAAATRFQNTIAEKKGTLDGFDEKLEIGRAHV